MNEQPGNVPAIPDKGADMGRVSEWMQRFAHLLPDLPVRRLLERSTTRNLSDQLVEKILGYEREGLVNNTKRSTIEEQRLTVILQDDKGVKYEANIVRQECRYDPSLHGPATMMSPGLADSDRAFFKVSTVRTNDLRYDDYLQAGNTILSYERTTEYSHPDREHGVRASAKDEVHMLEHTWNETKQQGEGKELSDKEIRAHLQHLIDTATLDRETTEKIKQKQQEIRTNNDDILLLP